MAEPRGHALHALQGMQGGIICYHVLSIAVRPPLPTSAHRSSLNPIHIACFQSQKADMYTAISTAAQGLLPGDGEARTPCITRLTSVVIDEILVPRFSSTISEVGMT